MKTLILFLFTTALPVQIFAASNKAEKVNLIPTKVGTKSEVSIPDVVYNPDKKDLSISFKSNNGYVLSVADEEGNVQISQYLETSGRRADYSLMPLSGGIYTICISSVENDYIGDFEIK